MKQATVREENGKILLDTPFDGKFLEALKKAIPYTERSWDRAVKVWVVTPSCAEEAIALTRRFFDVVDGRQLSAAAIEDVQIEAEIAQIADDQNYIKERRDQIVNIISHLSEVIGRFSFSSKSRIKSAFARDRALLKHSLDNAELPVERLTELQVRGLAAARRLLERGKSAYGGKMVRW